MAPPLWFWGWLLPPPLTPPVTLASCREAEGRRVCLSPKGELASRLHDGSGTGDVGGSGATFFWSLFLVEQEK